MKTNLPGQKAEGPFIEKKYASGVPSKVGEEIAFFHLGSSIVLVFESPEFLFTVKPGQKVKVSIFLFVDTELKSQRWSKPRDHFNSIHARKLFPFMESQNLAYDTNLIFRSWAKDWVLL